MNQSKTKNTIHRIDKKTGMKVTLIFSDIEEDSHVIDSLVEECKRSLVDID